jgi:hypothetical protein
MPSFQSPLPSDESRLPKRKLHEPEQSENTNSKRRASGTASPYGSTGDTQYWMVQWYVPFKIFLALVIIKWAIIKESSSSKETQDMGGGWGPRCDQTKGCSHGPGRPHVCIQLPALCLEVYIGILGSPLGKLAQICLRVAPN